MTLLHKRLEDVVNRTSPRSHKLDVFKTTLVGCPQDDVNPTSSKRCQSKAFCQIS